MKTLSAMYRRRAVRTAKAGPAGFTIVELLVSTVVLAMLMMTCVSAVDAVRRSVTTARGKAQQYREARQAFELISKTLAQATLNTYWDYYYTETGTNLPPSSGTTKAPSAYVRRSELQFQLGPAKSLLGNGATQATAPGQAVFFQAPLGLTQDQTNLGSLLNARGYAVEFSDDLSNRPPFLEEHALPARHRYRLIEYRPPAEKTSTVLGNAIYTSPTDWFRKDYKTASRVVADNIILLILSPRVTAEAARTAKKPATWIAPNYAYNSLDPDNSTSSVEAIKIIPTTGEPAQGTQHVLPPLVAMTLVALDEPSAARWAERSNNQPVDFLAQAGAPFTDATQYDQDIESLQNWLNQQKLNHEVFSTTITLRNARWDNRSN